MGIRTFTPDERRTRERVLAVAATVEHSVEAALDTPGEAEARRTRGPGRADNIHIGDIVITVVRTPPRAHAKRRDRQDPLRYDAHTPRGMG